jgi:hypothetical protein
VGQDIGKLLGGLSEAIKGAQKDAIANRLMTDQDIASQPGAGQTQDLGTLPSDGTGGGSGTSSSDDQLQQAMAASRLSAPSGTAQDLGQLPSDSPMTPDPSGAQIPTPSPQVSDADLSQAMAASQLGGGPTVGSIAGPQPGGPQPAAQGAAQPAGGSGGDWNLSGFGGGSGRGTVGGLVHTGGVQEMELQEKMQQMQAQKAANSLTQQEGALRLADARAKAGGTGNYALDAALKRAQLLEAQRRALNPNKPVDLEKNPPPATNLDTEPVLNETQLAQTVNKQYGAGAYEGMVRTINEPEKIDDPKNPGTQISNPNGPQITGDSITLGPKNKRITMPLAQAKILARQHNSVNFKKGLPLIRVPDEDQTLGATQDNPYPIANKLDMVSRAHRTWVRLPKTPQFPNGQIAQVP